MKWLVLHFALLGVVFLAGDSSQGQVLFSHTGTTDPVSEGWTLHQGGGTSKGPVHELGVDAWSCDDDATTAGSEVGYIQYPTGQQTAAGNLRGWVLRANVRVVDLDDTPNGSVDIYYRDGWKSWQVHFGSESDGDPIVKAVTGFSGHTALGPEFTLQDAQSTYHLYELRYDPIAGTADLFVDGIEQISNYAGFVYGLPHVYWGAGSSADTGHGNWNLAEFEILPVGVQLQIDIKPGSYPNSINLGSNGVVPVAILSTEDFDACTVDETTVRLAGAFVAIRGKNRYLANVEDVNDDGLPDLVCHVDTEDLDPGTFQDGYAFVTGFTVDGDSIEGFDEITIVPPE